MSNSNNRKSPFIGLKSFDNFEDYKPFKQESQVEDVLEILQSNNLVTITGEAHSGKTSLINSGLIPRLKSGFPGQVGRDWSIVKFRPGVNPIENFCYSLSNTASLYDDNKPKTTDYIEYKKTILRNPKRGFIDIYRKSEIYKKKNLLIIIDNLDDLYSFPNYFDADESDDEDLLFNVIYNTLNIEKNGIYFVLTINNNNYRQLNVYDDFIKLLSQSQYQIPFFSSQKIAQIVSNTFKDTPIQLPQNFIEKISNVFFKNYSFLPNLQLFLNELFIGKINVKENDINVEQEINNVFSNKLEEFYNSHKSRSKIENLFRGLIKSDYKNSGLYYEKIENLKTFLKLNTEELNHLIINIENNVGEIFGCIRINDTGILKKNSFKYSSGDILYLKYRNNLNWTIFNSWVDDENDKFSRFKDYYKRAEFHPGKETIISEENIQSAVSFIDNEINENWTSKYSFDFQKVKKYIDDNHTTISEKIRIRKEFEHRTIKKSRNLKRFGVVFGIIILVTGVIFAKLEYDNYQELKILGMQKDDLERQKVELNEMVRLKSIQLKEDSLKMAMQNQKMQTAQSEIIEARNLIAFSEKKVSESQELVSKALLENENSRLELSTKQELLLRNEKVISLINSYSQNNKNISSLLFNIKRTVPTNLENIKDISLKSIDAFQTRNKFLMKLDSIKNIPNAPKLEILEGLKPDDNPLRQLSLNLIAKLSGVESYSDVTEVDYIPNNNHPINVLATSKLGRVALGGDSRVLYRSKLPFNASISREETLYDQVKFDSEISSIEFIDEDVLAVGLSNGYLWYTNIVTKDKVQLFPVVKKRQKKILNKISNAFNKNQIIDIKFIKKNNDLEIGKIYVLYSDKILIYNLSSKEIRLSAFDKLDTEEYFICNAFDYVENNFIMITNKNNLFSFYTKDDSYSVTKNKVFNFNDVRKPVKLNFYKNQILAATSDGWIYIYDFFNNTPSYNRRINAHETEISNIHTHVSKNHIFSASIDGSFSITVNDEQTSIDIGKNNYITDFAYTQNMGDRDLLTADKNGNLIFWEFDIEKSFERLKSLYNLKFR